MKLGHLFAVPLAELRLDDPGPLTAELSELFLAKEAAGAAWRNEIRRDTQHGALFESRFDLFKWPEAPVRRLAAFCHRGVASVLKSVSDYPDADFKRLAFDYHAWFHVTRRGGYQGLHNHQNATWSGIFCVDPGDDLPDKPQSGAVRFHDPRGFADQYIDAGNQQLTVTFRHGSYQIRHEAGKLLVFPSYLTHEVFPYEGERPRIVVAFNCWVHIDDAPAG